MHTAILLLGSNLGDPKKNIEIALELLEKKVKIIKVSNFLISKPEEFVSSNFFCNIATSICVSYTPIQLLDFLKKIEKEMGRAEDSRFFGEYRDRVIDIDIVRFNNLNFKSDKLVIPHHKNLFERSFSKELLKELY